MKQVNEVNIYFWRVLIQNGDSNLVYEWCGNCNDLVVHTLNIIGLLVYNRV